jgi:hypothetical protein
MRGRSDEAIGSSGGGLARPLGEGSGGAASATSRMLATVLCRIEMIGVILRSRIRRMRGFHNRRGGVECTTLIVIGLFTSLNTNTIYRKDETRLSLKTRLKKS